MRNARLVGGRHLDADEDASVVGALVPVVEQADVPARRHAREEAHERARPLREKEAVQPLVVGQRAASADHVANVLLRQFVVGQVERREAVLDEGADQLARFIPVDGRDSHEDMGDLCVGDAVVELGDRARAEQFAESAEAASLLRNRHREQRFSFFADLGAFCHEAQAIEVHVGAAGDRDERLPLRRVIGAVLLDRGHAERTGRLENAARVLEHVLDRRASGIGVDNDELVDDLASQSERLLADQLDRGSVGKEADVRELDPLACFDRTQHRVGVGHLDSDDPDLGSYGLDVGADPRDQAASADGDKDGVDRSLMLAEDLHRDRSLSGDHIGIVERVNEGEPLRRLQVHRVKVGVGVAVPLQHHLAAQCPYRVDLE